MDRNKLQKCYGRLKGLKDIVQTDAYIAIELINDYNSIVDEVEKTASEDLKIFKVIDYKLIKGDYDSTFSSYLINKLERNIGVRLHDFTFYFTIFILHFVSL